MLKDLTSKHCIFTLETIIVQTIYEHSQLQLPIIPRENMAENCHRVMNVKRIELRECRRKYSRLSSLSSGKEIVRSLVRAFFLPSWTFVRPLIVP